MGAIASPRRLAAALVAAGLALSGCATEEYVDQQIADTNARIDQVHADTQAAMAHAQEAHRLARGEAQHAVLMRNDSVTFDTDSSYLSGDARALLADFAETVKAQDRAVNIELVGHGDSTGRSEHNLQLGQRRADAVLRFLHSQGIPLHRMSAISYGESRPRASNATRAGRAENRRVELVVLG
jgi:outer membrane protein OmpA-like peptidoglycan-associated protein